MKSEIKDFINRNEDCKIKECPLCGNHCRDCRHLEIDNDYYNDGTRRCDHKSTSHFLHCSRKKIHKNSKRPTFYQSSDTNVLNT